MNRASRLATSFAALLLGPALAWGQTPTPSDGWRFELVPYLWTSSLDGSIAVGGLPETEVDASFGALLENLDFAASTFFTARRGDLSLLADLSYTALEVEESVAASTVTMGSDLAWVSLAAGKALDAGARTALDVFAGARWSLLDNDARSTGGVSGSRTKNETWIDPIVGVVLSRELTPRLAFGLLADVGGFGVGSDLTYDVLPSLAWSVTPGFSLRAGYRWLDVDYEDDDFEYDVRQAGFVVGLGLRF